jgi:hypothetical protein
MGRFQPRMADDDGDFYSSGLVLHRQADAKKTLSSRACRCAIILPQRSAHADKIASTVLSIGGTRCCITQP